MSRTTAALERIRTAILSLKGQLEEIRLQKRSRTEVKAYIGDAIDRWTADAAKIEARRLYACVRGDPVQFMTVTATVYTDSGAHLVSFDMGPLLVTMIGADAVRDALQRRVHDLPEGMPSESRHDAMVHLENDIAELEEKEETALRACWADGDPVAYRPDADPAVVLTHGAPKA